MEVLIKRNTIKGQKRPQTLKICRSRDFQIQWIFPFLYEPFQLTDLRKKTCIIFTVSYLLSTVYLVEDFSHLCLIY